MCKDNEVSVSKFARDEISDFLHDYIEVNDVKKLNFRAFYNILTMNGFEPKCNKTNCMLHEAATAIAKYDSRKYIVTNMFHAQPSNCDCKWESVHSYLLIKELNLNLLLSRSK